MAGSTASASSILLGNRRMNCTGDLAMLRTAAHNKK
jgi:hypothetical protein